MCRPSEHSGGETATLTRTPRGSVRPRPNIHCRIRWYGRPHRIGSDRVILEAIGSGHAVGVGPEASVAQGVVFIPPPHTAPARMEAGSSVATGTMPAIT